MTNNNIDIGYGRITWTNLDRTSVHVDFGYRRDPTHAYTPVKLEFDLAEGEVGLDIPTRELFMRAVELHEARDQETESE